jgi:hypothetical protein
MTDEWQHVRTKDVKPIDLSRVHVVTMISNVARFRSRYDAYRRFAKHMHDSGAQLTTVEVAYGKREFEVTDKDNPRHVQLRTEHEELWLKEPAWNIGLRSLPQDWQYVIFLDADITFTNNLWLSETVHQLQTYMVVQPFAHALDMGPQHEVIQKHNGFAWSYHQNMFQAPQGAGTGGYYGSEPGRPFWHPGYGIAFRRECFEGGGLEGLLTTGILGSGDHHMWLALIGEAHRSLPGKISDGYRKQVLSWQADAERVVKRDIGYTPGTILHTFGGSKRKRFYVERWSILEEQEFNPDTDLRTDWQGLPQLVVTNDRQRKLRDLCRAYFRARDEDNPNID